VTAPDSKPAAAPVVAGRRRVPFSLLTALHGDDGVAEIFSEASMVRGWLATEAALAIAQARVGLLSQDDAEAIAGAAVLENIDLDRLWTESRNVGYPILPLVRMLAAGLPDGPAGRVHYGATTQDIMDTGLSLQLDATCDRFRSLLQRFGDALARRIEEHAVTVMAARTHGQQAVPTTLGAKLAVYLDEVLRHHDRLAALRTRVGVVSVFGAGGTNAAMGKRSADVRKEVASVLGLSDTIVPWHVARDSIAEFGLVSTLMSGTCARLAREVIDLSRTEIAELRETGGADRGASSTMPQKENPISSEAVIGMSSTVGALSSAFARAMEGGHERAAGEWQIEWQIVPQVAHLTAGCLTSAAEIVEGLRVYADAMNRNLEADNGLVMSEAYMMRLAPGMGRGAAHDVVYDAAQQARNEDMPLVRALLPMLSESSRSELGERVRAEDYLGEARRVCAEVLRSWREREGRNSPAEEGPA